jgi:hypothetical protein
MTIGMDKNAVQMPRKQKQKEGGRKYFTKSGLLRNKRFARGALEVSEKPETLGIFAQKYCNASQIPTKKF